MLCIGQTSSRKRGHCQRCVNDLRGQGGIFRVNRAGVVVFRRGTQAGIAKFQHDLVVDGRLQRNAHFFGGIKL